MIGSTEFLSGMVLGLACSLVGGLAVSIWAYNRPQRGFDDEAPAPQPPLGGATFEERVALMTVETAPPHITVNEARKRMGLPVTLTKGIPNPDKD